jgi:nitroimidazol reductase NimA-like FMN-containing flavoprotein (pyridoxamine 5'-phosphate oxidase superfamily)
MSPPAPGSLSVTPRTTLRRRAGRGSHDRAEIDAILDEALVCHVAFVADGAPVVIPTAFVRVGDHLYLHGAVANRMLGALAAGAEASIAVTLLDGLVLARTAFHHSMNYRSVVLFGRGAVIEAPADKARVLDALLDRLAPGRSRASRPADAAELAATLVIAFPIAEASAKARRGPPLPDEGADAALPYWAGVIPLVTTRGAPIPAPDVAP